jgi:hypothetical protein
MAKKDSSKKTTKKPAPKKKAAAKSAAKNKTAKKTTKKAVAPKKAAAKKPFPKQASPKKASPKKAVPKKAAARAAISAKTAGASYVVSASNESDDWTIIGWSYQPDQGQEWTRLRPPIGPRETGQVLTCDCTDAPFVFYVVATRPGSDQAWYSPAIQVNPNCGEQGITFPVFPGT